MVWRSEDWYRGAEPLVLPHRSRVLLSSLLVLVLVLVVLTLRLGLSLGSLLRLAPSAVCVTAASLAECRDGGLDLGGITASNKERA